MNRAAAAATVTVAYEGCLYEVGLGLDAKVRNIYRLPSMWGPRRDSRKAEYVLPTEPTYAAVAELAREEGAA